MEGRILAIDNYTELNGVKGIHNDYVIAVTGATLTIRDGAITLNKVNIQKCSEKQINAVLSAFGLPSFKLMPKDPKDVEINSLKKRIAELEKIALTTNKKEKQLQDTEESELEAFLEDLLKRSGVRIMRA